MKKWLSFILALGLAGSLSACEIANNAEKDPVAYPVEVANVTVEQEPERVVCLSPSLTELAFAAGCGDRLVGRTEDASSPEEVRALPTVGKTGHIDTAALAALEPDTVLTHESLSKKEMDALEAAGIKVVVLPMAKSMEELEALYVNLGLLFHGGIDGESRGEHLYRKVADELAAIRAKLPEQPSFLYIINPSGTAATGDTLESSVLSQVFGENIAAENTGYAVDMKEMAAKNPGVIFVADPYGLPHLEQDSSLKALDAVKNKRVASVDPGLFARQGTSLVEAVYQLAAALYPEQFPAEEAASSAASSEASSTASQAQSAA